MHTLRLNPLLFVSALVFFLRMILSWIVGRVGRIAYLLSAELFWLLLHNPLTLWLLRQYRIIRIATGRRIMFKFLKWRYRPRKGDAYASVFVILMVAQCAILKLWHANNDMQSYIPQQQQQWHPPQMSKPGDSVLQTFASTRDNSQSFHQLRYFLQPGQSLHEIWQRDLVEIESAREWSQAFAQFFDAEYSEELDVLPIRIDLLPVQSEWHTNRPQQWYIQRIIVDLNESYQLELTPTQALFGQLYFMSKLQDKPTYQSHILIQGSVARMLTYGQNFAIDRQGGELGETGTPIYVENLMLYLDRVLEQQGGLNHQDYISAVYSAPNHRVMRLEYVEVRRAEGDLELVRYSTNSADDGFLYQIDGSAIVPSDWQDPMHKIHRISSGYGLRVHPIVGYSMLHRGIDYTSPLGTPVRATKDGLVLNMQFDPDGYGNWIRIKHSEDFSTVYAHLQGFHPDIKLGYPVKQNQIIGFLGNTGRSTGPHLHYEVHFQGQAINPKLVQMSEKRLLSPSHAEQLPALLKKRRAQVSRLRNTQGVSPISFRRR